MYNIPVLFKDDNKNAHTILPKRKKVRAGQDQGRHFLASTNTDIQKQKQKVFRKEFLYPQEQKRPVDLIKTPGQHV